MALARNSEKCWGHCLDMVWNGRVLLLKVQEKFQLEGSDYVLRIWGLGQVDNYNQMEKKHHSLNTGSGVN